MAKNILQHLHRLGRILSHPGRVMGIGANGHDLAAPKKIWDSIVLWKFQEQFLRKERKLMTVLSCPKCGILKQGVPEDLDEFAAEILEEM